MPRRIGQQVYYRPEGNGGRISVDGARAAAAPEPPANVYNGMRDVFETASRAGGNILRVLGYAYRTHQRGLVDEAIVNAAGEFEAWKADYMRDNQGKDAMAAQVDFTRKWAEISEKTMGDFGGEGTIFRNELKREMFKRGLYAFRDGGDWQNRQTDAWRKSVWKGRLAEFEQTVAEHPEDGDRIKMDFESLMQSWQANNPGLDPAAARAELWDKAVAGRVQSFLARKDTEGAWAALYEDGGGSGGAADLPPARGTIAEDHFNPLNLKHAGKRGAAKDRSAFRVFNNDGEGYRGAYRQLLLYQDRDGLKTPEAMISKWAPRSENNLEAYRKTLEKHGVAWDREIDLHDQEQAAKFLKAASAHEGPVGQRYSAGEIREMLDGAPGKRGSLAGIPKGVGAGRGLALARGIEAVESARERERVFWENRIEAQERKREREEAAARKQAQRLEVVNYMSRWFQGDMDETMRWDIIMRDAEGIDNPELRRNALNMAREEIKFREEKRKAGVQAEAMMLAQAGRAANETTTKFMERLLDSGASEEVSSAAVKLFRGEVRQNYKNIKATNDMLLTINNAYKNGMPLTDEDIFAYAFDKNLTQEQTQRLLEYNFKGGEDQDRIKYSDVAERWYEMLSPEERSNKKPSDAPAWLYPAVKQLIGDRNGKPIGGAELRQYVAKAMVKGSVPGHLFGNVWRTDMSMGEALANKRGGWRPDEEDGKKDKAKNGKARAEDEMDWAAYQEEY